MIDYDRYEKSVDDFDSIKEFIKEIETQPHELVLINNGEIKGAVLTARQYQWFLDQMDDQDDYSHIKDRIGDYEGSVSLDELKQELAEEEKNENN